MKQKKHKKMLPNKDTKKTMDVSKPGNSTPDTSARPVIVTNRSMVQDPTMKDQSKDDSPNPIKETPTRGAKTITPVSNFSQDDSSTSDTTKETDKPEPETPVPEKSYTEKEQAKEAAVVDAVADQATEDKKKKNKDSDADIARKTALEKLITDKKYFVPIGQVSRRRNRRALIVFFVVIILLIGGYLVLDAELIKSSISLPLDLIKT